MSRYTISSEQRNAIQRLMNAVERDARGFDTAVGGTIHDRAVELAIAFGWNPDSPGPRGFEMVPKDTK